MEKEKAIEEICEHTNEFQNALLSALDVLEDESEKCVFSEKNKLNHATLIRLPSVWLRQIENRNISFIVLKYL